MEIILKRRLLSGADRWLVAEVDARDIPGARGDRCLVFQSDHVARRMWDYPPGWYTLSDAALAALCEGKLADVAERRPAPPVAPRSRPRDHEVGLSEARAD